MTLRLPPLLLGPTTKGVWAPTPVTRSEFVAAGHTLLDGSLTWPALTLDADALAHNIAELAAFTGAHGLAFAPHGKTTMSPELFAAQLDAGAWGITVATGNQLLAAHSFGVRRLLVANEVLDPTVLRWIALDHRRRDPVLRRLRRGGRHRRGGRSTAARSGCCSRSGTRPAAPGSGPATRRWRSRSGSPRSPASSSRASAPTRAGCPTSPPPGSSSARSSPSRRCCVGAGLLREHVILSAGGSAYFDAVADVLGGSQVAGIPSTTILRSGSYVTHDHGTYVASTPFTRVAGDLRPALRIWAQVSRPRRTAWRSSAPASATCRTTPASRSRSGGTAPVSRPSTSRAGPSRAPTTSTPTWRGPARTCASATCSSSASRTRARRSTSGA